MILSDIVFYNNIAYYDSSISGIPYPYLLKISTSNFYSTYTFSMDSLNVTSNIFYNALSMFYFSMTYLTIKNSVFTSNGVESDSTSDGLIYI